MSKYVLSVHAFCSALTDDQLVIIVDEIQAQANARPFACTRNTSSVEAYLPLGPTSNLGMIAYIIIVHPKNLIRALRLGSYHAPCDKKSH